MNNKIFNVKFVEKFTGGFLGVNYTNSGFGVLLIDDGKVTGTLVYSTLNMPLAIKGEAVWGHHNDKILNITLEGDGKEKEADHFSIHAEFDLGKDLISSGKIPISGGTVTIELFPV